MPVRQLMVRHGACIIRNRRQFMARSRGGLISKIYAVVDPDGPPIQLALTAGEARPGTMLLADRSYEAKPTGSEPRLQTRRLGLIASCFPYLSSRKSYCLSAEMALSIPFIEN